jgi:hypothetical protein
MRLFVCATLVVRIGSELEHKKCATIQLPHHMNPTGDMWPPELMAVDTIIRSVA